MKQMLNYRTVFLAQTGICSGVPPMALRSTPHQSLASSISVIDDVIPTVTVRTYPNQKPRITGNFRTVIKGRAAAFKERDSNPEAYKKSRYALRRTIKQAKHQYRTKIEPTPMLVECGRACKLLQNTKGSPAESCPVT